MSSPFQPACWLSSPHFQTIWPALTRPASPLALHRERLELDDGDFLDLDWGPNRDGPLVTVLHGLEGSSRSGYVGGLLGSLESLGWQGVVMHFRGCSGEPNRLTRSYHAGDTGDLNHVMSVLARRYPGRIRHLVGYSLGANVLLKWLGQGPPTEVTPQAAVAISVPFLLEVSAQRLERGFSRIYQQYLLRALRQSYRRKFSVLDNGPVPVATLGAIRSLYDFDNRITAPLHGFRDARHYYQTASCRTHLGKIRCPTLLIQSLDDPFMHPSVIPDPAELSPMVSLELHDRGGHVGFVEDSPWRPRYYLERRIPDFLQDPTW